EAGKITSTTLSSLGQAEVWTKRPRVERSQTIPAKRPLSIAISQLRRRRVRGCPRFSAFILIQATDLVETALAESRLLFADPFRAFPSAYCLVPLW
ncbi:MAG: hypothetical protein V3T64_10005, partial [Myxococcota bacterium]